MLSFLGNSLVNQRRHGIRIISRFDAEFSPDIKLRLKVETNTREHFTVLGFHQFPFEVHSSWFDDSWLKRYGNLFLSADLNNYPGTQYTQPGSDLFGCFSDALPDRWGRTLLNRREQIVAMEEKRPIRRAKTIMMSACGNISVTCLQRKPVSVLHPHKSLSRETNITPCCLAVLTGAIQGGASTSPPP